MLAYPFLEWLRILVRYRMIKGIWELFAPSVKTPDIRQQGPITMSVRSDDGVESLYSIIFLTSGSCHNFPSMAFTAICHFDFNNLMIKPDHVSDLARIISQILQHGLSPREQLCPLRERRVRELHQHMRQIALEAFVHGCVELG